MATHSSILAWRILWTEKSGGLWSRGSGRVGHYLETEKHQQNQGVGEALLLLEALGRICSLGFSASRGHIYSWASGPFLHLQSISLLFLLLPLIYFSLPLILLPPSFKYPCDCIELTRQSRIIPMSRSLITFVKHLPSCKIKHP